VVTIFHALAGTVKRMAARIGLFEQPGFARGCTAQPGAASPHSDDQAHRKEHGRGKDCPSTHHGSMASSSEKGWNRKKTREKRICTLRFQKGTTFPTAFEQVFAISQHSYAATSKETP
jgi:hypothetical protein